LTGSAAAVALSLAFVAGAAPPRVTQTNLTQDAAGIWLVDQQGLDTVEIRFSEAVAAARSELAALDGPAAGEGRDAVATADRIAAFRESLAELEATLDRYLLESSSRSAVSPSAADRWSFAHVRRSLRMRRTRIKIESAATGVGLATGSGRRFGHHGEVA